MNTYYYFGRDNEIEAILRDGFTDNLKNRRTGRRAVCITACCGKPGIDSPTWQLLEIVLPPRIDISKFRLRDPRVPCGMWLVPARMLNKHAKVRLVSKQEWEQTWVAYIQMLAEKLIVAGLLEHQPIYEDGHLMWPITEKGRGIHLEGRAVFQEALKVAYNFSKPPPQRSSN